eukprot:13408482-Alexandrium_andersonii.AAC.1
MHTPYRRARTTRARECEHALPKHKGVKATPPQHCTCYAGHAKYTKTRPRDGVRANMRLHARSPISPRRRRGEPALCRREH